MLKAWVRVSDVARNNKCHLSTKQRLRDRYQAIGTVKDRRRSTGQSRTATDVKTAPYVDCILTIFTSTISHAYGCLFQRKVVLDDSSLRVPDEIFLNIGLCYWMYIVFGRLKTPKPQTSYFVFVGLSRTLT